MPQLIAAVLLAGIPWETILTALGASLGSGGLYALADYVIKQRRASTEAARAMKKEDRDALIDSLQETVTRLDADGDKLRAKDADSSERIARLERRCIHLEKIISQLQVKDERKLHWIRDVEQRLDTEGIPHRKYVELSDPSIALPEEV